MYARRRACISSCVSVEQEKHFGIYVCYVYVTFGVQPSFNEVSLGSNTIFDKV